MGRDHSEDRGVNGRIILKWILSVRGIVFGSVDWINLNQDRDWWWALVKTVLNLWVP
jgi:hypothetical protein